ncbi:MAG TPA: hypothetical protein ENI95_03995 [Chloroflexi bacterium]|nr:hypothetical protein [Chloroflexota bacterium]
MRLLHEIGPEETPVSKGRYRYLVEGEPTGQFETWQITRLPDGSEIVRADVDGRRMPDGANLVTHLLRRADGRPVRLRLRYTRGEVKAAGQYTFEEDVIRIARQVAGYPRRQETLDIATGYEIDYHPVIAHDYVWRGYPAHARGRKWAIPIFSPDLWAEGEDALIGRALRFTVRPLGRELCRTPAGEFEQARHFEVVLDDGVRALAWYNEQGIPLRWYYPDKEYDFVLIAYTESLEGANVSGEG